MVALSFASDAEANIFYKTVTATIANRSKKRRSRKFSPTKTDGGQDTGYDSGVVLRNQNSTGKMFFLPFDSSICKILYYITCVTYLWMECKRDQNFNVRSWIFFSKFVSEFFLIVLLYSISYPCDMQNHFFSHAVGILDNQTQFF